MNISRVEPFRETPCSQITCVPIHSIAPNDIYETYCDDADTLPRILLHQVFECY